MTTDSIAPSALDFSLRVEHFYAALIRDATPAPAEPGTHAEPTLGGKLLYAAELDAHGRALLVAGNIAGAASLAATADSDMGKQAVRDGVADFLVNSLDEGLRILKNEIRKREAVAVCIAASPESVERAMLDRGVLPDLLPPVSSSDTPPSSSLGPHAHRIEIAPAAAGQVLVTWRVDTAPAQWLPKLDAIALHCLRLDSSSEGWAARRWLRLAPRYLGNLAHGIRVLHCKPDTAKGFIERVQNAINGREIGVGVRISLDRYEHVFLSKPAEPNSPDRPS